jgi:DNA polymerase-3 subunit delta'
MTARDEATEDPLDPRRTPDLLGHAEAERTILSSWEAGRLPHAWLISGPEGIGKATLAFRLGRFLLAQGGEGGGLFGAPESLAVAPEDPVFQRVASGGHADLMTVRRSINPKTGRERTEIVVDDVRAVSGFLHQTAAEGGWRVVVIDPADDMNANAANAVLKVLEEPPARAVILLIAHNPGRLLPTIRSRCTHLALRALAPDDMAQVLQRIDPDLSEADRQALARLAEGSPGKARALLAAGGLDLYRELVGLLGTVPGLDAKRLHALADKVAPAHKAREFETVMELLAWWLARMVRGAADGQGLAEIAPREGEIAARLAQAAPLADWLEVWEKVRRLAVRADAVNLDRKQVVLSSFFAIQATARG